MADTLRFHSHRFRRPREIASAAAALLLAGLMVTVVVGASLGEEVRSWPTPESLG